MSLPGLGNEHREPTIQHNLEKDRISRFDGFDFLRATFAVAIVALHAELFSFLRTAGLGPLENVFNANVAYIAVPVFLQISLFLFCIKIRSRETGSYFFQKRLPKLIYLYLFWVASMLVFNIIFGFNGGLAAIKSGVSSVRGAVEFVVSGGNSPLYFFFSLIFLSVLSRTHIFLFETIKSSKLKTYLNYLLLCLSCLLVLSFFFLGLVETTESRLINFLSNLAKWNYNPLNFLPYVFTTAIVANDCVEGRLRKVTPRLKLSLYSLFILFLGFTLLEWLLSQELLHYSRVSLIFGSWLLLYLALLSTRKVPEFINFVSGCSLGIYTLHLFFTHGFFSNASVNFSSPIFQFIETLVKFAVALLGSIALTLVFRKNNFLKKFV